MNPFSHSVHWTRTSTLRRPQSCPIRTFSIIPFTRHTRTRSSSSEPTLSFRQPFRPRPHSTFCTQPLPKLPRIRTFQPWTQSHLYKLPNERAPSQSHDHHHISYPSSNPSTRPYSPRNSSTQTDPQPLSPLTYQTESDAYMNTLLLHLEQMAEQLSEQDIDVEYSAGVLTTTLPQGTYVVNKQPPNQQIWLSSPVSGPKRYDFRDGKWVYLRDGSTLDDLLRGELGVDMSVCPEEV